MFHFENGIIATTMDGADSQRETHSKHIFSVGSFERKINGMFLFFLCSFCFFALVCYLIRIYFSWITHTCHANNEIPKKLASIPPYSNGIERLYANQCLCAQTSVIYLLFSFDFSSFEFTHISTFQCFIVGFCLAFCFKFHLFLRICHFVLLLNGLARR